MRNILLTFFLIFTFASGLEASRSPIHSSYSEGIVIDGNICETAWQNGTWHEDFYIFGSNKFAKAKTKFAIRNDNKSLYIAVVCNEPYIDEIQANVTERDGSVYNDDCIQIFLDPIGTRAEYMQLCINSKNVISDRWYNIPGVLSTGTWNPPVKTATAIESDRWVAEIEIPFAAMPLESNSTKCQWAINVCRKRMMVPFGGDGERFTSYAKTDGTFHSPDKFAVLFIDNVDLTSFLWDTFYPSNEKVVTNNDGTYDYHFTATVTNNTSKTRNIIISATLDNSDRSIVNKCVISKNSTADVNFVLPFEKTGSAQLSLKIADADNPNIQLVNACSQIELKHKAISVVLKQPSYRNCVYATQKIDSITAQVKLGISETEIENKAYITAKLLNDKKQIIHHVNKPISSPDFEISLPFKNMAVGKYIVQALVTTAKQKYTAQQIVTKLDYFENEWRIDQNLTLLHNGKPFLPFGWFSHDFDYDPASEATNVFFEYHQPLNTPEWRKNWMDKCYANGGFCLVQPWPAQLYRKNVHSPLSQEEQTMLRDYVRGLKNHPAVMAYYLFDEPELHGASIERLEKAYEIIKAEDPYHPVIVLNNLPSGIPAYSNTADIFMPDPYCVFRTDLPPAVPITKISKILKLASQVSQGQKALWVTPQGFDYFELSNTSKAPDFIEIRNQQIQAIIQEAKGFLWYVFHDRLNNPSLEEGAKYIGRETQMLRDAILAQPVKDMLSYNCPDPANMFASYRKVKNETFIFTVNTSLQSQKDVCFSLQDSNLTDQTLYVVGENRQVKIKNMKLIDDFDKYEAHIYTTDKKFIHTQTVSAVQKRIDSLIKKQTKNNNIAHISTGAKVSTSDFNIWGAWAPVLNNGSLGMDWLDATADTYPDWIQVEFPEPRPLGRVIVYGNPIEFQIQTFKNGVWSKVYEGNNPLGVSPVVATFEPKKVKAFKTIITKSLGGVSKVKEIEAYSK